MFVKKIEINFYIQYCVIKVVKAKVCKQRHFEQLDYKMSMYCSMYIDRVSFLLLSILSVAILKKLETEFLRVHSAAAADIGTKPGLT